MKRLLRSRSLRWSAAFLLVSRASGIVAVPLVLGDFGPDLYAVWVLAGVLVMSQGLVDLGMAATVTRYASAGAAAASRRAVLPVLRHGAAFYAALTAVVSLVGFGLSTQIDRLPYIAGAEEAAAAATIVRYAIAAFALLNVALLLSAALQGLGRIDAAYRALTLGWLAYVPTLAVALSAGGRAHAVGLAWLVTFGAQAVLLAPQLAAALRALPPTAATGPGAREMLSLGTRWQVSGWADFSTFQLPRLLGAAFLPSSATVAVDVALRFAQTVVTPVYVALPLILPRATAVWATRGRPGLQALAASLATPAVSVLAISVVTVVPLSVPAIALWTGIPMSAVDVWVTAPLIAGLAAHASTGVLSSSLLATGDVTLVLRYKRRQLALAVALVSVGAMFGAVPLAFGAATALMVPAVLFNRSAAATLGAAWDGTRLRRVMVGGAAALAVLLGLASAGRSADLPAGALLGALASGSLVVLALLGRAGLLDVRPLGHEVATVPPGDAAEALGPAVETNPLPRPGG